MANNTSDSMGKLVHTSKSLILETTVICEVPLVSNLAKHNI
jgi:hypothetical protein